MNNLVQDLIRMMSTRTYSKFNLKTNIITRSGGNPLSRSMTGSSVMRRATYNSRSYLDNGLSTYYLRLEEIASYENSDLSNIIVDLFAEYILGYIKKDDKIVEVAFDSSGDAERLINGILHDLDIVGLIKDKIKKYVYYDSYGFKLGYNPNTRNFFREELVSPCNVVNLFEMNQKAGDLVESLEGNRFVFDPYNIFKIGNNSLDLIDDMSAKSYNAATFSKGDTVVNNIAFRASQPLYYNMLGKVKEFILKDTIVSLLSIKDLVQPLILLIKVSKSTGQDDATNLALATENLIGKYADLSQIMAQGFSVSELIETISNNIRVLPDYDDSLSNIAPIDLSKLTDKIMTIRSELDNQKEDILTNIGIPFGFFKGETTKYEAIKNSERLQTKIHSKIVGINTGLCSLACDIYYLKTGKVLPLEYVTSNLFNKTAIEYNNSIAKGEIGTQLHDAVTAILDKAQDTLKDIKIMDKEVYLTFVKDLLKDIDPTLHTLILDKLPKLEEVNPE